MTLMARVLIGTAALALGAVLAAPLAAIDPPPEEEALARMTTLMETVHQSMETMREEMARTPGAHPMHERLGRTMGMADEMRGLMHRYREHRRLDCAGPRPAT